MGIYGLEGSKPGAAVAAVYLSHKVIRPTRSGYGQIHRKALFNRLPQELRDELIMLGRRAKNMFGRIRSKPFSIKTCTF